MTWRPVDFECQNCGCEHEETVWIATGDQRPVHGDYLCPYCKTVARHDSVIGLTAPYMGEKVLNPRAFGGSCDTMGAVEPVPLPDLPGQAEHSEKLRKEMSKLPDTASSEERSRVFSDACKDAPSSADYSTLFESSEYKEVEAINKKIDRENKGKQKRAKALAKGENVNMRRDKCPGDPNMTA